MADSRRELDLLFLVVSAVGLVLITRPERQVVAKKLHDQRGVLVRFFVQGIKLSNGVVKRLRTTVEVGKKRLVAGDKAFDRSQVLSKLTCLAI